MILIKTNTIGAILGFAKERWWRSMLGTPFWLIMLNDVLTGRSSRDWWWALTKGVKEVVWMLLGHLLRHSDSMRKILMLTRYGHQECGQYKDKMISVSKTLYNISNDTSGKGFVPSIRPRGTPWVATQETTPDQCTSCQNCKGKGNAIPCQVFFLTLCQRDVVSAFYCTFSPSRPWASCTPGKAT